MSSAPIVVEGLVKTFRQGLLMRRVEAVRGISFAVERGEIFGFLGPNGAGKTTTIKMLTGLIRPTAGSAKLFGQAVPSPEAMKNVGFSPENPYVYPYLTPREYVTLLARLSGLHGPALARRAEEAMERTGIAYAADRPARRLSKGMLQRTGLAGALVSDPELLVLDEPMSGLDPVGRKEVRDLVLEERQRGKTVFFSTHILSDVETMCDRVVILRKGLVVVSGKVRDLLRQEVRRTEITLAEVNASLAAKLASAGFASRAMAENVVLDVEGEANVAWALSAALEGGARVVEVVPRRETLEALFMQRAIGEKESPAEA
ncbi:MAG TPA: ABC transporter ATP-binding protein [Polyangiaceae bacterium]